MDLDEGWKVIEKDMKRQGAAGKGKKSPFLKGASSKTVNFDLKLVDEEDNGSDEDNRNNNAPPPHLHHNNFPASSAFASGFGGHATFAGQGQGGWAWGARELSNREIVWRRAARLMDLQAEDSTNLRLREEVSTKSGVKAKHYFVLNFCFLTNKLTN